MLDLDLGLTNWPKPFANVTRKTLATGSIATLQKSKNARTASKQIPLAGHQSPGLRNWKKKNLELTSVGGGGGGGCQLRRCGTG